MGRFNDYSIEQFISEIEASLKANLNTYISEMNTDKGDFSLSSINSEAFYIQTLDDAVVNYDDFVFIFEDGVSTEASGPYNSETYTVVASIVSDVRNKEVGQSYKKMFRYREILKRIIQDKCLSLGRPAEVRVSSLSPFAVSLLNQTAPQMGIGVSMEVSFA